MGIYWVIQWILVWLRLNVIVRVGLDHRDIDWYHIIFFIDIVFLAIDQELVFLDVRVFYYFVLCLVDICTVLVDFLLFSNESAHPYTIVVIEDDTLWLRVFDSVLFENMWAFFMLAKFE
jgi:hypothetical protein